jgi:hypothetical protein
VAKPTNEPTVYAYGMRAVGNGKWEAFEVSVPVSTTKPLSPVHKEAVKEAKWIQSRVPDTSVPDHLLQTVPKLVLGEVETGKWKEMRGERRDHARARLLEALHLDELGLRAKPKEQLKEKKAS